VIHGTVWRQAGFGKRIYREISSIPMVQQFPETNGNMEHTYITIKTFGNAIDAELFRIELLSVDIESIIADDYMVSTNPFLALAIGGVKVKVKEEDVIKIMELMPELNLVPEYKGTIHEKLYLLIKEWYYNKSIRNILVISVSYILIAVLLTFTCETKLHTQTTIHKNINYNK
jgi:hypothetical protein